MTETPIEHIRQWLPEFTALRRDIHAHPETGFEEQRTSDLVAARLAAWGIEVHRNIGRTGVVGVLRNGNGRAHRAARRHGCAGHAGGERLRACLDRARQDAWLRA